MTHWLRGRRVKVYPFLTCSALRLPLDHDKRRNKGGGPDGRRASLTPQGTGSRHHARPVLNGGAWACRKKAPFRSAPRRSTRTPPTLASSQTRRHLGDSFVSSSRMASLKTVHQRLTPVRSAPRRSHLIKPSGRPRRAGWPPADWLR